MRMTPKRHQGPTHGGPERPGTPGSSPSTLPLDGLQHAVRGLRGEMPRHSKVSKVASLSGLHRGAY